MQRRLINKADAQELEYEFNAKLRYPNVYSPRNSIDGTEESSINVITVERPDEIDESLWGILPLEWADEWAEFQEFSDTTLISEKSRLSNKWYADAFTYRRCLILATSYFINHLHQGQIYSYRISSKADRPFCLAGIYNRLGDGFLTSSIITSPNGSKLSSLTDLDDELPIVVSKENRQLWLSNDLLPSQIENLIKATPTDEFYAVPEQDFLLEKGQNPFPPSLKKLLSHFNISRESP